MGETRQVFDLPSLKFEVTEHHVSQATVVKAAVASAGIFQPTVDAIGQAAVNAAVLHADETGLRVAKKLHWLHGLATDTLTWMGCHPKRGGEAFDALALLQQFNLEKAVGCTRVCRARRVQQGGTTTRAFAR